MLIVKNKNKKQQYCFTKHKFFKTANQEFS